MKTLLSAMLIAGLSAASAPAKIPPSNISTKIDTTKLKAPKPGQYKVPKIETAFDKVINGDHTQNPDGSFNIGSKIVFIASTPTGPGLGQATAMYISRADKVTCQDGSPTVSYTPSYPNPVNAVLQSGKLAASVSITVDQFLVGGKCKIGQPDSATVTLTIVAKTNAGTTAVDKLVFHMIHFNN